MHAPHPSAVSQGCFKGPRLAPPVCCTPPTPGRRTAPHSSRPHSSGSADDDAGNRSGVRCLPAAMILGGFQCGSQSLWAAVYKHPLIVKVGGARACVCDKTCSVFVRGRGDPRGWGVHS